MIRHSTQRTRRLLAAFVAATMLPVGPVASAAQGARGPAAPQRSAADQQLQATLEQEAGEIGERTDPLGNAVGTTTIEGLALVRDTYLKSLAAWKEQLQALR